MSRMTKFLKQTCKVQPYLNANAVTSDFDKSNLTLSITGVDVRLEGDNLIISNAEGYKPIFQEISPLYSDFGEIQYAAPIVCKCRREDSFQDIQTSNGSIIRSRARYFLDASLQILPDYLIDGAVVISVQSYVNQFGKTEGYEVYV